MNFKEFLKDNQVIEIDNSYENLNSILGMELWVCDYRLKVPNEKLIRNLVPTFVKVLSNDVLPRGKDVFYSPIHFRKIKNGKVSSNVVQPYDNTGWRNLTGSSLNIFYKKEDCINYFLEQCEEVERQYKDFKKSLENQFETKIQEVEKLKNKFKEVWNEF